MRAFGSVASLLVAASVTSAAPGILLIGDSTVTDGAGWGKGFCADTKGLARCTNLAVSGTTTTSWPGHSTEYQAMLTGCKTANTFATIQFGHNDQKVMTTDEFAANLEKLTNTIKNAGCSPILVTSLARRVFASSHTTTDILGPYSNRTITVANKLGLPILPLLADSLAYIQKLGKADSMKFNLDYNTTNKDTTHLNELGSLYFGRIVADEVKSKISALAPYIVANATLSAKIAAAVTLTGAIPHPKVAPSILTIGDSTVTSDAGWGAGFCADTKGLANCTNLSVSGRTTISWQAEPEYQTMLTSCKTPETWATIQFGHNDQKVMNTSYFAQNLESLTLKIQSAGCKPILVTSLARRVFASEHVTTDILGPYADETINVAAKLKLPLLPLLNDSLTYVTKLGKTQSMLFNWDYNTTNKDTTHLNALGWKYFGRIVADEVHTRVPQLSHYIAPDRALSTAIANGTILPQDL
ncbi:unnamed protein product [Rhizoctonia solani]|uniref:SGNH hydrolase-type esterase domain-containing protein n=1 Tax=Rhizoctonia solani TaxID=456999 RepID=A0A8H3BX49_9AGAM|nr:unnamed protein product [Rhizoctonia solani]